MDNKLLDFIQQLSKDDTKTLTGKALKITEEQGELAREILPFENAAGTLHRFASSERLLEESVDVILTAISIAYSLGFTHQDVEDMMLKKATKWQGLQAKEKKAKYPLPYEIHITVEKPDIDYFKKICEVIGVKPIVIDLQKYDRTVQMDVMTSSKHIGDNTSAYFTAKEIEKKLKYYNFNVLRTKIETVPWHPAAPSKVNGDTAMPTNCYFESHLRIVAKDGDRKFLKQIAEDHGARLSRNNFKILENGSYIVMMTLRKNDCVAEEFSKLVENLKDDLKDQSYTVDKTEIEFAIYDTKQSHDYAWIV